MLKLRCVAQNYDWGIRGPASTVGRLFALGGAETLSDEKPYAELWMGTHPSGPSQVLEEGGGGGGKFVLLREWLAANPSALGEKVQAKWGGELPFLFKVLSVAKALSIQAHPDKALAEKLHASQPQHYKDANHKPEMTLAVTPFEALCEFVTSKELENSFAAVPELREAVGEAAAGAVAAATTDGGDGKDAFRAAFTSLMTADKAAVEGCLSKLVARLEAKAARGEAALSPREALVLRLQRQYPGDVGVLASFFLNHLTLAPGEAVALRANEPHAYLAGECVECMAASDNVIRAGLTPKFRDVATLCASLTYNQGLPKVMTGDKIDEFTSVYKPPFEEFEVFRSIVPAGRSYRLPASTGASILLVFKGSAAVSSAKNGALKQLECGDIYLVPAGLSLELAAVVNAGEAAEKAQDVELFRACVNSDSL